MKRFKNNKVDADTWCGMEIQPAAYYEIQYQELQRWQNDSKVLSDIGSGDGVINNGTSDITDVSTAINFLKDEDTSPRDIDGAPLQRAKITKQGWTQFNCFMEFQASKPVVQHSKTKTMVDGWATVKCYKMVDAAYVECVDAADALANCVRTVLDWEPDCDYEIIGGEIRALDRPTSNFRVRVIAVPDVPYNSGGSKVMGSGVNLKFYNTRESVHADGRTVKLLSYNAVYHTNKIRFIADHAQGDTTEVMIKMESYMA